MVFAKVLLSKQVSRSWPFVALLALMFVGFPGAMVHSEDVGDVSIRGVLRAETASTLASEIVAPIVELPFKNGQSFAAGDVLIAFDCARHKAELRAAKAEAKGLSVTVEQDRFLLKRGAAGANDLEISKAKLEKAEAAVEAISVTLDNCVIRAPFDGRVAERLVDLYETPQANKPLLKIVKDGALELDLIVPSHWMVWLQPGQTFTFTIDETQSRHAAEILHLGAIVDPISRTTTVSARLKEAGSAVRPGMSGFADLAPPRS